MNAFAVQNLNEEELAGSSAGGAFSLLAKNVLDRGGAVYGAAFDDNWHVRHVRISSINDLHRLRGSKYAFSHINNTITNALEDLQQGIPVLFSGTPCQIAALKKRAGDNQLLLLVEVICHGAPKHDYWEQYLNEICIKTGHNLSDIISVNCRDKSTGWKNYSYTIVFSDGSKLSQQHPDNLYFRAFIRNYTLREACFKCPFKYPNNKGDIILGDFWSVRNDCPEIDNDQGLTLCIAVSPKGNTACENLPSIKISEIISLIAKNKSLTQAARRPDDIDKFISHIDQYNSFLKSAKKFAGLSWRTKLNIFIAKKIQKFTKG